MIRLVTAADAGAIANIYNHYVQHSVATFEERDVSIDAMRSRIEGRRGPWLVDEQAGVLRGYCYAKPWHTRSAYRHSFESTIYLRQDAVGTGLGRALYEALFERLAQAGAHRAVGVIALPNPASVALHERCGFVKSGELSELGHKFGRFVDVGYWLLALGAAADSSPG